MSDSKSAIAERKRQRKRAALIRRASLTGGTLAAMAVTPPRSWWMIALSVAFGWWARSRVRAHRSNVSETLGQRSWAVIAQLQGDYTESEIETLRLLDTRVVMAVESGDLASIEPLLDEVESIVTPDDAARTVHDLRAFVLATRGAVDESNAALARASTELWRPWPTITRQIHGVALSTDEREFMASGLEQVPSPVRALVAALDRPGPSAGAYRVAARRGATKVAFESWLMRVAPTHASALAPWPSLSSAMGASWNHPSTATPIAIPTRPWRDRLRSPWAITMLSLAALQALAVALGRELVVRPTLALVLLFLAPIAGLFTAAHMALSKRREGSSLRRQSQHLAKTGWTSARRFERAEHLRIELQLRSAEQGRSREALSLVWSLGAPRDRALVLRRHAVTLAWAGLADESEAVLARLDEEFMSYTHTTTARFEARLVGAAVNNDRRRAEKIAREFVDTLPVTREIESLWKCVYAALVDRSLRDEARAQVCWPRERAPWVLELLEDERVRVDASDREVPHEAQISSDSSDEVKPLRR